MRTACSPFADLLSLRWDCVLFFFHVSYLVFNFLSLDLFISRLKYWLKLDEILAPFYRPLTRLCLYRMTENVNYFVGSLTL